MIEAGVSFPPFSLLDHNEDPVSKDDLLGRWTVLWWYVKAGTPG